MALTWFIGIEGLATGYRFAAFLRSSRLPNIQSAVERARGGVDRHDLNTLVGDVLLEAMAASHRITFPLSIAQALLSALLVVTSLMVMSGRRGARALALQALAANAILALVSYVLMRNVWASWIAMMIQIAGALPAGTPQRAAFGNVDALWWALRARLVFAELGTLALAAFALTRPRVRSYFEAAARAADHDDKL